MHNGVVMGDIVQLCMDLMWWSAGRKESAISAHSMNTVVTMPTQTKHCLTHDMQGLPSMSAKLTW